MTRSLFVATLIATASVASLAAGQDLSKFNPGAVDGRADVAPGVVEQVDSQDFGTSDNRIVRNCLVVAGLGIMFCVGMAITATTISQNRPSTPQQTTFYAS